ncbi:MAG: PQQ-binding-like beta-propeller repeat protein [Flavobacteriales bacterium]|nr:PQQ-binding-like beta-propeller repeat protein [Flavobacteriales bacterium]MBK7620338.1 PQQ-binding-like beta-propeller repeat protein [Flavobacteriales bacterium]MBP8877588.1 PQQ-binding-like beta-propeller repeat protein [Flavobacteriales bacterium]MBP9177447.1 PQQ-binding-like beta-propeller repeat protein [Flavobacteriales bacterium]
MLRPYTIAISFLSIVLSAVASITIAQTAPVWETSPGGGISWMRTTSTGNLLVCTSEGLKGLDPESGAISWTVKELANAPEAGYQEINGTPFISLAPTGAPEDLVIMEPFSGNVVFNSKEAGISKIVNRYFLYPNNAIVVVGQKADKSAAMACVDMGTGKVRWTKDDKFSRLLACNSVGPDELVLSTLFFAYKINTTTGDEVWKKCPDPGFEKASGLMALLDKGGANLGGLAEGIGGVFVTTPFAPGLCFMGMQSSQKSEKTDSQGKKTVTVTYKTFINAFHISDGSYAWATPLEMQQQLGAIVPMERGLLIGAGDKRSVDLLDYKTGDGIWGKKGKGINVKGILSGAVAVGDRMLLTSGGSDGVVMLIDAMGMEVWKKPVKLDGVVKSVTLLSGDVLLASEQEVEVVDMTTGSSRLDKTIQGGAGLVATGGGLTYIFNTKDGLLHAVSKDGGAAKAVSSVPLKFEGKEDPTTMEYTENGLVITSDQNMALIGTDGGLKYQKYFPAPRESGLVRALKYASAIRAAYYAAAFGYTSAAFGAASQSIQVQDANSAMARDITGAVSDMYGEGSKSAMAATDKFMQEANARFKATTSTNAIHFMLSEVGKGTYALQGMNKADGSTAKTIPLGSDKTPIYEVDGFDNAVYLANGSKVMGFR